MTKTRNIIAGLDVGTTKICVIVAEQDDNSEIRLLGVGIHPSRGLRKGEVINVNQTAESIRAAVDKAENICEFEIASVYAGIAGGHIESFNSRAVIPISNPAVGVTEKDMIRAGKAAQTVALPRDREIIHTIPQAFSVDTHRGILNPEGKQGTRLEAQVHLITGRVAALQDIINCIRQAGLDVGDIVLQQLASSLAVVRKEEQEAGVVLIDIGGGTTDYVFFRDEIVLHTKILSVGGDHLTNDISLGMKLLIPLAEELKKREGKALFEEASDDSELSIAGALYRHAPGHTPRKLCRIIEARMTELFQLIRHDLEVEGHFNLIGSGLVLTGGGALLEDIDILAARVTGLPVRIGTPTGISGLREVIDNPIYSTAVGLVKYGFSMDSSHHSAVTGSGGMLRGVRKLIDRYF